MNYHLKRAGSARVVHNFSSDIKDSEAYTLLLNQLHAACDLSPLRQATPEQRAAGMLQQANKFGVAKYVAPADVVSGNGKLNLAFVANIFNTRHGLVRAAGATRATLSLLFTPGARGGERAGASLHISLPRI